MSWTRAGMMEMKRRDFLFGAGAVAFAAACPVNIRQVPFLWGDGEHDDTEAMNAFFRGERIETSAGVFCEQRWLIGGKFILSDSIILSDDGVTLDGCELIIRHDGPFFASSEECLKRWRADNPRPICLGRSPDVLNHAAWVPVGRVEY